MRLFFASDQFLAHRDLSRVANSSAAQGVAPHGGTDRWAYTVPTGKVANVVSGQISWRRDGTTGAPGRGLSWLELGGFTLVQVSCFSGNLNDGGDAVVTPFGPILAGETFHAGDLDQSVGGTFYREANLTVIETDN